MFGFPEIRLKGCSGVHRLFKLLSVIFTLYFLVICISSGFNQIFSYIWLFAACVMFVFSKLERKKQKAAFALTVSVAVLICAAEIPIVRGAFFKPDMTDEYIVVLGAKADGYKPSEILKFRLEEAVSLYEPGKTVIVTGGKGSDEIITEAECMQKYLISKGIPEDDIIMENKAVSTYENLLFTSALIDTSKGCIIVTSDFHTARAMYIAKQLGYENISTSPSKTRLLFMPNYYLREIPAFVKAIL